jgi:hypothetical protein
MNVPRGTPSGRAPVVRCLAMRNDEEKALRAREKTEHRVLLDQDNCNVHPGAFRGLDLETGRVRLGKTVELRARCAFESGPRAVTVTPVVRVGDLFWVRPARFTSDSGHARGRSKFTLGVVDVGCARLQDMDTRDAIDEGAECVPKKIHGGGATWRDWFAAGWDACHAIKWDANPWVWIYRFEAVRQNVDKYLEGRR